MSNSFNFVGTVAADAEVRYTPSNMAVLTVRLANNIGFGDKQKTLWIRATLFGKRAEGGLADYLKKGRQVFVSGQLSQNEYQAKDGTTKTSLEVNATTIDLVGGRQENSEIKGASGHSESKLTTGDIPVSLNNSTDFDDIVPF